MSATLVTLETTTTDVQHEKNQLEFRHRDMTRQLQSTEQDRDRLLRECEDYHAQRRDLDGEKSLLERDGLKLESKIEALQQQLRDREENMNKSTALQRAAEEAKAVVEEKLAQQASHVQALQEEVLVTHEEIDRLTEAIARQHGEQRQLRDKMKIKNEVIRRQESLVQELRLKHVEVEQQLVRAKDSTQTATHQVALLTTRLAEAGEKADEFRKLVDEQKQVVAYLSDEVNRFQLGERLIAEPSVFPKSSFLQPQQTPRSTASPSTPTAVYSAYSARQSSANYHSNNNAMSNAGYGMNNSNSTPSTDRLKYSGASPETGKPTGAGSPPIKSHVGSASYLVQGNLSSKNNNNNSSNVNNNEEDGELVMKGLQTLGLSKALRSEDLGFDVLLQSQEGSSVESTQWTTTRRRPAAALFSSTAAGAGLKANMQMDELDYYALDRPATQSQSQSQQLPSANYKYAWQDPDFGKYDE
jgi:hypothetical protein